MKKIAALAVAAALALTGCTTNQETVVRLATHDSFYITDEQIAQFESETGFELELIKMGDTGALTNQLVLTKNAPVADAFFGIDNTFLSVATSNGVTKDPTAISYGDVCFNYDIDWFTEKGITPPSSWRELGDPRFKDLVVVSNPRLSSPGLAFLATTHAGFETSAEVFAYWRSLRDNGVKVVAGWNDAYFTEFTRYEGSRPIVLSYASSPAAEVKEDGTAGSAALLDECFRQTEYAGVVEGSKNPAGAKALIGFFLTDSFQAGLPENMFVYPMKSVELPAAWAQVAQPANSTIGENLDFEANREQWLKDWSDVFDN
jgi:thiamine transport system substrate-binding protein